MHWTRCPECGTQATDGATVCPSCGRSLAYTPATPHTPATWKCRACGAQLRLEWDRCPQCGYRKSPAPVVEEKRARRRGGVRLVGLVMSLLGFAVVVLIPVVDRFTSVTVKFVPPGPLAIIFFVSGGIALVGLTLLAASGTANVPRSPGDYYDGWDGGGDGDYGDGDGDGD